LLSLPDDLQSVIRTAGLEGSKVLELRKVSGKNLHIDEAVATDLRIKLIHEIIHQGLSLDKIRSKIRAILKEHSNAQQQPKSLDLAQRLSSIPKQLKQARVWEDTQKRQKLEKLLNELEGLLF
jgi:ParB family chromosome partitioning protein